MDILPFTLTVEVELAHILRTQLPDQIRHLTVNYNPVALAIKDKLAELSIPFTEVYCIIDPDGLGCYSKLWGISFNGKRYAFQADLSPEFYYQWFQFSVGQRPKLIVTLEFGCLGEDKTLEAPPKKPYVSHLGRCFLYAALTTFALWLIGLVSQGPLEILGMVGVMLYFFHPKNIVAFTDPDSSW